MASLANQTISSSYDGLIKTATDNAVGVSGVQLLEDGSGNSLALSVGRANNGVTITGDLNATLATAAQPNITSVGTLTSLNVGNIAMANALPTITMTDTDLTDVYSRIRASSGGLLFEADEANQQADTTIRFEIDGSETMRIESDGDILLADVSLRSVTLSDVARAVGTNATGGQIRLQPITDDAINLGSLSNRWDNVYAANGTIQTSDANEKQQIESLDDVELRVATRIKGLVRKFKWNSAVDKKGDDARIHIGVIAQDVKEAFELEGLDPNKYALFCSDTWWEKEVIEIDSEGVETTKTEVLEEYEEGANERTRLGVRYTELLAFVISAL